MNTESIPLPPGVRDIVLMKIAPSEFNHWAAERIVAGAAREHMISRRKAATLLGYESISEREAFFERNGLTSEYTLEMVDEDFAAIDALRSKR